MYKRNISIVICLVLFWGLFFQYNRSDGFIRLIKNTNSATAMGDVKTRVNPGDNLPVEKFLVVYDPEDVNSLLLKKNIETVAHYLKKEVVDIKAKESASRGLNYSGIILALENLDNVKSMSDFREYVRKGGTVYFMARPAPGATLNGLAQEIGFSNVGGLGKASGVKMHTNLLIGGKDFEYSDSTYVTSVINGAVDDRVRLHMSSGEGVPLLWECKNGKGQYVVYNGSSLADKVNRGLLTAMLGLGRDVYLYPVVGIKVVYIDDFPSPIPEGTQNIIYQDFGLKIPEFFRYVWWPDMLKTAEKYNVRYTGLIIETYSDSVSPPFEPEDNVPARTNLIVYGRELLKSGGELGVHGYNHQPLAPDGYKQKTLGYIPWQNEQDMTLSLQEVKRYVEDVYPGYSLKVYVPPSNILSPEGRSAVTKALPDLKVIASLYAAGKEDSNGYVQDFGKSPDGIWEMPRISSDYTRRDDGEWIILNAINSLGIFSHFVHPDDLFFTENEGKGWKELYGDFDSLMKDIYNKYGWLRGCTASHAADYLENYLNLDYRVMQDGDKLKISCWGFRGEAYFILKTAKKIKEYQGCQVDRIDENVYLLKISSPEVNVRLESGGLQ